MSGGLLGDLGGARHRGGAAGGCCAAKRPQAHDSYSHVEVWAAPPVAMQHRHRRPSFQVTLLKFRNNLLGATVFPNGMRFFA
jgi:hypothetical protein